jgi:hypothetical protein
MDDNGGRWSADPSVAIAPGVGVSASREQKSSTQHAFGPIRLNRSSMARLAG